MGQAIIVTGTPGTGKTSFSTRLAREIGARYVSLNRFVSTHRLRVGYDRRRGSAIISAKPTKTALDAEVSHSKGLVILDTHIPDGILSKRLVRRVFVLRCHPRLLEARLKAKRWKTDKIRENLLAELLDVCYVAALSYYGPEKVIQLDTSRNFRYCLSLAKRAVANHPSKNKVVDWIAKLHKEGKVKRYLK